MKYHWIMTLQPVMPDGTARPPSTIDGGAVLEHGESRGQAYARLYDRCRARVTESYPELAGAEFMTLFFALEPERLP